MKSLRARFTKRLTSWEGRIDVQQLYETEFRKRDGEPDLTFSVYEFPDEESTIIQTLSEHSTLFEPNRSIVVFDTSSWFSSPSAVSGTTGFANADGAHREYHFKNKTHLLVMLHILIFWKFGRFKTVTKAQLDQYIRQQFTNGNSEWLQYAQQTACKKWVKKIYSQWQTQNNLPKAAATNP